MADIAEIAARATPYELVGGPAVVRGAVDRFYDLMDEEPGYARLRALHAPDLSPMRDSLTDFLIAWLGGPRRWFEERPGACVMSAHKAIRIDAAVAEQWIEAMTRALAESGIDLAIVAPMADALADMARAMVRRAGNH
jgi:hemoglobin